VLARRGDEAFELGLGESSGALSALSLDLQRSAVTARAAVDESQVERVGVEAGDRCEPSLERLGRERRPVGFVVREVVSEVVTAHGPDIDGPRRAPDEERSEVGRVSLARIRRSRAATRSRAVKRYAYGLSSSIASDSHARSRASASSSWR
jgi:hypothetical protein